MTPDDEPVHVRSFAAKDDKPAEAPPRSLRFAGHSAALRPVTGKDDLSASIEAAEPPAISAEAFTYWLALMRLQRKASSDADCARLLGVSANTVLRWKAEGAAMTVALACAALAGGLPPFDHIGRTI